MHDTVTPERNQASGSRPASEQLERVELLIDELKQLLDRHNSAFDDEVIHRHIILLEHWVECYQQDTVGIDTFTEASIKLLNDLSGRLKFAAEEMQRLEGEGGNPASREQDRQIDDMVKAVRRSQKLIADIAGLFANINH